MADATDQTAAKEALTSSGVKASSGDHSTPKPATRLKRELGVPGAVIVGLGSILGTGVFVSIGLGAGIAGPAVVVAIVLAAFVALCNGLSSAQLAAAHPVSGGTYEYGNRLLNAPSGFIAGWMFLTAKSASAATAALGFAGYLIALLKLGSTGALVPMALGAVLVLTLLVIVGLRRSNQLNVILVGLAILSLIAFTTGVAFVDVTTIDRRPANPWSPFFGDGEGSSVAMLLHATALMFVAYTGYGRIATMGEEVREPKTTIPKAVLITLTVSALLYAAVGVAAIHAVGSDAYGRMSVSGAAPLELIARAMQAPGLAWLLAIGATCAMLGVLLNLILGLSRVLLAMGRRGDMPNALAKLDKRGVTPVAAVVTIAVIIAGLAMIGDVKKTWTLSAFTVLIYYGLTNLCALRLPPEHRLYPRAFAWMGLVACFFLAWWVPWQMWAIGLGIIAVGLVWHLIARRTLTPPTE